MRPRILVAEPLDFSPRAAALLREWGEVELRVCQADDLPAAFREYDVIWIRLAHRITHTMMGATPRCRILACAATGLDHLDLEACTARGIRVVSLRGETEFLKSIRAAAELTMALVLALLRKLPAATEAARAGDWHRDLFRGQELFGKTAGIVGVGRLGTLVAGYLRAFGAHVLGYDIRPDFPHAAAERVASLEDLLRRSDLVFLLVNYHATTRHLLGRREFARMKRGAVLVNTSRGGVVDEAALLEALEADQLAGAALDVVDGEPAIRADHPIIVYARTHDNIIVTPHVGGNTVESFEKTEVFVAGRIAEVWRELSPA